MEKLIQLLRDLEARGFFGTLEVKFQNGEISLIRVSENFRPEELNTRGDRCELRSPRN